MEPVHEGHDRVHVVRACVARVDTVDAEDAVLVEADVDDVRVPRGDCRDRRVVTWPVEDSPALDAGVLHARAVDAVEVHLLVRPVQQVVTGDVEPRERRRGWWWRRTGWPWRRWRRWMHGSDLSRRLRARGATAVSVDGHDHDAHPVARVACAELELVALRTGHDPARATDGVARLPGIAERGRAVRPPTMAGGKDLPRGWLAPDLGQRTVVRRPARSGRGAPG